MREVLLIARREYLERVRSRAFLVMTMLFPLFIGVMVGGSIFAGKLSSGVKKIAIASDDLVLAREVAAEMQDPSSRATPPEVIAPATDADRAALSRRVEDKTLDGYLWLEKKPDNSTPGATFVSRTSGDLFSLGGIESAVDRGIEREQLIQHGISRAEIDSITRHAEIQTLQLHQGQLIPSNSFKSFFGGYAMMFLIYFTVVFYGMNVARSVVEEKTSRIFEVLLSTVRPQSLMAGKLLGVGAAGLTQMAIWVLLISAIVIFSAGASGMTGLTSFGIHPQQLFFLVAYFLLGFFFYSAIAAALGASVSSEQEIQQFSMVIVAPLTVGMILISYITSNPTALPVVLLSLFPPCTPVVMLLRMSSQMPPAWEIGLSMLLMLVFIWGAIWMASRIYRVGILMYGKRATLPEMLRWLRYS
jgi:ABC-2 type transport system permease protein